MSVWPSCSSTNRSVAAGNNNEPTTFLREINMNPFDSMVQRNKAFAVQQSAAGTLMPSLPRALPNEKATIIGWADMRVDRAHVLGIKPGEAVVMRNIGGRITPGLLEELGLLGRIGDGGDSLCGERTSLIHSSCCPPRTLKQHKRFVGSQNSDWREPFPNRNHQTN